MLHVEVKVRTTADDGGREEAEGTAAGVFDHVFGEGSWTVLKQSAYLHDDTGLGDRAADYTILAARA